MECWTCQSNSGEKRISPGPTIFEGQYWLVEHAYPVKTIGWLVMVLKRHVEELHCEKEYVSCYAEQEHFQHIHFHVFAKPPGLPDELKGGKSFALLKVISEEAVPPDEIISFCKLLKDKFAYTPSL